MTTWDEVAAAIGQSSSDTRVVTGVSSLACPLPGTLSFVRRWTEDNEAIVVAHPDTLFVVPVEAGAHANTLTADNPRLVFARLTRQFLTDERPPGVAPTASISPDAQIGLRVSIGHFTVVEEGVTIGDDVRIGHHVVLCRGVTLADRVTIGHHTTIGGVGFGFETEADGQHILLPHQGGVQVGPGVEIGSHCSIASGTIDPTRLADNVKLDDCVFIAHNVQVDSGSFIIAGAEVSGGVRIGKRAWIAHEAAVSNQVSIGDDALVGLGAVVVRDVASGDVVAGVPAKVIGRRYPDA